LDFIVNTPLVSVLIPTYNRPEYLRRAIESCLAQTYRNFEIIITDNSTNDDSAKMMARYGDPRLRYHSNGGNIGAVKSSNRAVELSQGKYVKFLMDDDLLKPRCLELMVEGLEKNPSAAIVMAPMDLIDEDDRRIYPVFYVFRKMEYRYRYRLGDGFIDRKSILRDFLTRDYPCCVPSGMMFRGDALREAGPFDAKADFAGDLDMCMRIAPLHDAYYIDEVLSSWRYTAACHTASIHQTGLHIDAFYYITRRCLANPATREMFKEEWESVVKDSLYFCSCRCLLNALAGLRARSPKLIWRTIRTIMREDPFPTNWLRIPLFALREIFVSIFPSKMPPARE
jgi:GT2 family glycosyltransferase